MTQLVSVPLEGGTLLIEPARRPGLGAGQRCREDRCAGLRDGAESHERHPFPADEVLGELRATQQPPPKVTVWFGIKVNADADFVVAKSAAEANSNVTIEWNGDGTTR